MGIGGAPVVLFMAPPMANAGRCNKRKKIPPNHIHCHKNRRRNGCFFDIDDALVQNRHNIPSFVGCILLLLSPSEGNEYVKSDVDDLDDNEDAD